MCGSMFTESHVRCSEVSGDGLLGGTPAPKRERNQAASPTDASQVGCEAQSSKKLKLFSGSPATLVMKRPLHQSLSGKEDPGL